MTEAEWLACTDPQPMLAFLERRITERQCRLFVAACLQRSLAARDRYSADDNAQRTTRRWIDLLERVADGISSPSEMESLRPPVREAIDYAWGSLSFTSVPEPIEDTWRSAIASSMNGAEEAVTAMLFTRRFSNRTAERRAAAREAAIISIRQTERSAQSDLLRCIVGNPFRPVALDAGWLTSAVVDLATAIYDERAFDRLGILADALKDAGCDNEQIIAHCRGGGPHVRGCRVVDLILSKNG